METALRALVSSVLIATGLLVTAAGITTAMGKLSPADATEFLNLFSTEKPVVVKVVPSTIYYY